eukprot:m.137243 g.137243  ORF g.137243 m.137243 type:complete len:353 (+) comp11475_c0_seq1:201-1259(+)
MDSKRTADDVSMAIVPSKRTKASEQQLVSTDPKSQRALLAAGPARTSSLMAPTMILEGHEDAIHTCQYSPDGNVIASGGMDRKIYLWNSFGRCDNFAVLPGHSDAINDVKFNKDGSNLYSASVDKTCIVWDVEVGGRVRKNKGHSDIVNCVSVAKDNEHTFVSASDDCTLRVWDSRRRGAVKTISNKFQVLACEMSTDGEMVYSSGLDNVVKIWDLKTDKVFASLEGHKDSVTGMALSPNGKHLVTNGMDNTVRMWDVQPYATGSRMLKVFSGAMHNFEQNLIKLSWTPDGKHIGCGSADRNVYVWEVFSQKVVYCLPGHKGSVNQVVFHPEEPIVLSCSTDKKMYQGELHL